MALQRTTLFACGLLLAFPLPALAVIGGESVEEVDPEFQYSVGLISGDTTCSGTLISPLHVLTAAHCVPEDGATDDVEVTFETRIPLRDAVSNVERVVVHPDYEVLSPVEPTDYAFAHDIAILQLAEPAPGNKTPIDVWDGDDLPSLVDGEPAALSGYGWTTNPHEFLVDFVGDAEALYSAGVMLTDAVAPQGAGPRLIADQSGSVGVNFGDSGGSLVREFLIGGTLQPLLIGLPSEVFDPDWPLDGDLVDFASVGPGSYGAYTPVGPYAAWIREATAVPEPSGLGMVALGGCLLAALTKRRKAWSLRPRPRTMSGRA